MSSYSCWGVVEQLELAKLVYPDDWLDREADSRQLFRDVTEILWQYQELNS